MSTSRLLVAAACAFGALTSSVRPGTGSEAPGSEQARGAARDVRPAFPADSKAPPSKGLPASRAGGAAIEKEAPAPWPPPFAVTGPADIQVRLERSASGARRLVVQQTGTFMHLRYREVAAGGPDWASIELSPGDRPPPRDVAVWESTDPKTLVTRRGLVSFSLGQGAEPEASLAEEPRLGPRAHSALRTCQSHDDGESGFAVVCRIDKQTVGVRAIRPASKKPLAGAWVWDLPSRGGGPLRPAPSNIASSAQVGGARPSGEPKPVSMPRFDRFVRIDLPLSPGGAEGGAIAFVHGGKGFVLRAEATWPSRAEEPALLFTETSRIQPVSPFFGWSSGRF